MEIAATASMNMSFEQEICKVLHHLYRTRLCFLNSVLSVHGALPYQICMYVQNKIENIGDFGNFFSLFML